MPQPDITLYHAPMTRSVRVRWALEAMGLPYALERVAFDHGNVGGAAYKTVNPLQKLPALKDGETVILESLAILQYLGAAHGPTPLAVAPDEPDHPRYLEWLHYGEATMGMSVNLLLAHTALLPEEHRVPSMAKWAAYEVAKQLDCLAERGLGDGRDWLAGGRLTFADMSVVYMLYLLKLVKQLSNAPEPVKAYWERASALDSWKRASAD